MAEVDEFLASVLPPLTAADTALHNGDAGPRIALWSHAAAVTLFGALQVKTGWEEIAPVFEWVASRFSNCESFEYEVLAAGASGDLAYIAGIEHTTAAVGDTRRRRTNCASRPSFAAKTASGEWYIGTPIRCQTVTSHTRSSAA